MYLLGSEFGGGTKLVLNQSFTEMLTSGKNVGPIDISTFAKIIFGDRQWIGQHPVLSPFRLGRSSGHNTPDSAGTTLLIQMTPSDKDNQAIIGIFGN